MALALIALAMIVCGRGPALALPLPGDAATLTTPVAPGAVPLEAADFLATQPQFGMSADAPALDPARPLAPAGAASAMFGSQPAWDNPRDHDLGAGLGGGSVRDALRGLVNVLPAGASPGFGGGARQDGLGLGRVDLGPAANEWIRETVQGILHSTLQPEVDDRGRTSFSVLGLGGFNVLVSGDRSEVALSVGDEVLMMAQRASAHSPLEQHGGVPGNLGMPLGGPGGTPGNAAGPLSESPLKQAMELVMELAGHPLSLLVYCIVALYLVLWTILDRQRQNAQSRPVTSRASAPESTRSRPSGASGHQRVRTRTRIRMRKRTHA